MNYNKIKQLITEKNYTIEKLAIEIGISSGGFHKMFKRKTLTIDNLEKISNALGVSMTYWFEENEEKMLIAKEKGIGYGEIIIKKEDYEFLKSQIKIKDEQIRYLQSLGQEEITKKQTGT